MRVFTFPVDDGEPVSGDIVASECVDSRDVGLGWHGEVLARRIRLLANFGLGLKSDEGGDDARLVGVRRGDLWQRN